MRHIKFKDCNFHDSVVKDITYHNEILTFYIPESHYENTYNNTKVEFSVSEYDFDIYCLKRYLRFKKVKLKGEEIQLTKLSKMMQKGMVLEIVDFFVTSNSQLLFECNCFPYEPRRGVITKIFFTIKHSGDCLIFKGINE